MTKRAPEDASVPSRTNAAHQRGTRIDDVSVENLIARGVDDRQIWQHRLDLQLVTDALRRDQQFGDLFAEQVPNLINDSFMPSLSPRLDNLDRASTRIASFIRQPPEARFRPGSRPKVAHSRRAGSLLPSDSAQLTPTAES